MKLSWPTRYQWTRGFLLLMSLISAWGAGTLDGEVAEGSRLLLAIYFPAYLLAGLLKPLHDSTGGRS